MSRCFPFPPPGYEKKTKTGELDFLLKEKQREKKHKKERKEKEKKERKEKREKDGSKEKHRDKDRKEKHKNRKREKDREKDKHKARDDQKIKERTANDTLGKTVEKHQVAEEKRFTDGFIRRIRDDGRNAGDRMVKKLNGMDHRQIEGMYKDKKIEVKTKNKEVQIEGLDKGRIIEVKDKNKEKRTEGIDMPRESLEAKDKNKERGTGGIECPKEDVMGNKFKIKEKPDEGVYRSKEDGMGRDTNKEHRVEGIDEVVGGHSNREWKVHEIDRPKEDILGKDNNEEWWIEGIDRPKDVKSKDKKKEKEGHSKNKKRHKEGGQQWDEKKGKSKDKGMEKEKEKEKIKEVLVHKLTEKEGIVHKLIEQKRRESGNKLLSGTVNVDAAGHTKNAAIAAVSIADHAKDTAKTASVNPNVRKRKEMEINGVLHDGVRLAKLLRPAFDTTLPLENGYRVETTHIGVHQAPDRQGGPNNRKPGSIDYSNSCVLSPQNKYHKINGKMELQLLTVSLKTSASATVVATSTGTSESIKPPHPDSEYLNQFLIVPKLPEWSDFDGQKWLFSSNDARSKQNFQSEIDGMPQVWSEALHIEAADMHALPYVIPY